MWGCKSQGLGTSLPKGLSLRVGVEFLGRGNEAGSLGECCKLPKQGPGWNPGKFEIWCNLKPQKSLQKCEIKYFPYCKHAVHLIMCKSYQGLDGDPARGVLAVDSQVSSNVKG